jgi:hypothetical protein
MGKAYAQMWSMDVKVDGKGVVRFSDIDDAIMRRTQAVHRRFPSMGKPGIGAAPDLEDCLVGSYDLIVPDALRRKVRRAASGDTDEFTGGSLS